MRQPAAGSDPYTPVGVAEERVPVHVVPDQAVGLPDVMPLPTLQYIQAAIAGIREGPAPVNLGEDGLVASQAIAPRVVVQARRAAIEAQPAQAKGFPIAQPERAPGTLRHVADAIPQQPGALRITGPFPLRESCQPA